ncbi:MarR family transcriptional regulator [Vallitalea longa]|uniref:MarR family transcriptional regulator n=1 Tax=Vallitalea longa TaxID=2936439 RepID=A0A9W6DE15_9FIRM|nr:MarR family transcriptional regulator [Vallitalea longa]GKX27902.1 MarR family transcriptional regulator [Vallitalea longa]
MFNLDDCVAFITNNASKQMENYFNDRLVQLGSTRVQWIALYYLGKNKSISQVELAKKMNIKSSTVVRLVDRMERDGYVKRVKDANDRRITSLELTNAGINLRKQLLPEGEKASNVFSKDITEEELEIFIHVLKKMVDNINE